MKILQTTEELINYRKTLKQDTGFVPTMGALHQGHISLIKTSISNNQNTIVSIFVNPTQFLEGEDFTTYPNRYQADLKICELAGVDALFIPNIDDIYFKNEPSIIAPMKQSYILEGERRPKHFDGVLQVVLKLLNLTKATNAYFGKKDAQQLFLIQNMVKTLFIDTNIVPCEIIRDENGLALSSRNTYLSDAEKQKALNISKSLKIASKEMIKGELNVEVIKEKMSEILSELQIEYIEITNRKFEKIEKIILKDSIVLVAAKVGTTRLIDNMWV
ncbi:pantoate--beta-alanine ligase [Sulfurospirillum arcachonense]|uniref:pantoate--beta-alanine ligase n=1 Tax=Sulfurospirillum arcachonense TaxID=57666 RepID=UPI0004690695|nr:pantoate--beta-alanine ligase [Sulfurospirillum arcachonense]